MQWVITFHIIAMVTWFAALFYLPRLFVYHAMTDADDQIGIERFKIMERKLYRGIMTPSAIVTVALGLWLLYEYAWTAYASMGWLHTKLALVVVLIGYHFYCGRLLIDFREDRNRHSHVFYRWFNEFPVLLLVAIVILVKIKPF
ncbi:TIGR00701 family protein [Solemya pervernicosa gill symbiont]|uniref:Protoporphyrinogen IX oxidase n=2 Tax=Gammaproteobacteria incertae sedis TaxID=118884 RepID=A0A1T2L5B6_9GAMM|nr:protoporphyrinogen oxidase HemJ [Candidatus Reidiella endopervernicosa]OOZ40262.1 TIGR00701 family protein [Solemya pervernicosa gill symbiont]QKQ26041.1 protoporphyrinogen oxidase HemJ [Candidatus Reidiella endopervernicosa]